MRDAIQELRILIDQLELAQHELTKTYGCATTDPSALKLFTAASRAEKNTLNEISQIIKRQKQQNADRFCNIQNVAQIPIHVEECDA